MCAAGFGESQVDFAMLFGQVAHCGGEEAWEHERGEEQIVNMVHAL